MISEPAYVAIFTCVLAGATLGTPIDKREAPATKCVDYTLDFTQPNSILLESVRNVCRAVKDLDKFITITGQHCTPPHDTNNAVSQDLPGSFTKVIEKLEVKYLPLISQAIKYGQNINYNSTCTTLEDERWRFSISSKLAIVQNAVQEVVIAKCRASNSQLMCNSDQIYPSETIHSHINLLKFKCMAKYSVAYAIRYLIEGGRDNDWYFGSVGCR